MRDFHVPSYLLTLKIFDGRCLLEDTQTQQNPGLGKWITYNCRSQWHFTNALNAYYWLSYLWNESVLPEELMTQINASSLQTSTNVMIILQVVSVAQFYLQQYCLTLKWLKNHHHQDFDQNNYYFLIHFMHTIIKKWKIVAELWEI